jgi:phosphate starvation-inducible membrane PsiE
MVGNRTNVELMVLTQHYLPKYGTPVIKHSVIEGIVYVQYTHFLVNSLKMHQHSGLYYIQYFSILSLTAIVIPGHMCAEQCIFKIKGYIV